MGRVVTRDVEHAVFCANGKIHYGNEHLRRDDRESVRRIADTQVGQKWCGGGLHYLATRERIVTDWTREDAR